MRERVLIVGGTLTNELSLDGGYTLEALLPLSEYDRPPVEGRDAQAIDPRQGNTI